MERRTMKRNGTRPLVKLPSLVKSLNTMSKLDLEHLVSEVCLRDLKRGALSGKLDTRPAWWPLHMEFASNCQHLRRAPLQDVIRSCYRYYGQEYLLCGRTMHDVQSASSRPANSATSFGREKILCESAKANEENKENPQRHDVTYSGLPRPSTPSPGPAVVEVFICFFCGGRFRGRQELVSHQLVCEMRPSEFQQPAKLKADNQPELNKPLGGISVKTEVCKEDFISSLGLVTAYEAESMKQKYSLKDEIDCEIIFVEEPKKKTPTTPCKPKSLISQLSRENNSPHNLRSREKVCITISDTDSDDYDDSDFQSYRFEKISKHNPKKLLSIDLTSNLGLRLKKNFASLFPTARKPAICVSPSWEKYIQRKKCHDEPEKPEIQDKRRNRNQHGYVVSYRPRKNKDCHFKHRYSFNGHQRRARYSKIKMNLQNNAIEGQTTPCVVKIVPLPDKVISDWTVKARRRNRLAQKAVARTREEPSSLHKKLSSGHPQATGISNSKDISLPFGSRKLQLSPERPPTIEQNVQAPSQDKALQNCDDSIAISSESEDEENNKRKRCSSQDDDTDQAAKRARVDNKNLVSSNNVSLLFRCHLCQEELRCRNYIQRVVKRHFIRRHNVHNINLLEHVDEKGNQVFTIVEMQTESPLQSSSLALSESSSSSSSVFVDLTDDADDDVVITGTSVINTKQIVHPV